MKKLAIIAAVFAANSAFAAPVGNLFTGVGVGAELASTKYDDSKHKANGSVIVSYGIDYGNNWVGVVEGKIKPHSTKFEEENSEKYHYKSEEKYRAGVAYLQGYRVSDVLPYVKLGYTVAKFNAHEQNRNDAGEVTYDLAESSVKGGISYGAGVKYAVSQDVEVGVDYTRTHIKFSDGKSKSNSFGANVGYRF